MSETPQWRTPKTNWKSADYFDLFPDYVRIRENILFLAGLGAPLGVSLADPPRPAELGEGADAAFFARVENALPELYRPLCRPLSPIRRFAPGDRAWSCADLDRIEGALAAAFADYNTIIMAQPTLAFTLGGDLFEP